MLALSPHSFARPRTATTTRCPAPISPAGTARAPPSSCSQANGYNVERWEQPLSDLAARADAQTVVIFAEPDPRLARRPQERCATSSPAAGMCWSPAGRGGAYRSRMATCSRHRSSQRPASSRRRVSTRWPAPAKCGWCRKQRGDSSQPLDRVQYNCAGAPAVVEYTSGKGEVIWWASSTPLENGSISRAENLNLFLNSLGARDRTATSIGTSRCTARRTPIGLCRRRRH